VKLQKPLSLAKTMQPIEPLPVESFRQNFGKIAKKVFTEKPNLNEKTSFWYLEKGISTHAKTDNNSV